MKDRSRAAEEAADNSIGFGGDDLKESDEIRTNESFWSVSQTDRQKQTKEDFDRDRTEEVGSHCTR